MKRILFFYFLIFINFFLAESLAQTKELDSLLVLLDHHQKEDTTKVSLLNDISWKYYFLDVEKMRLYVDEANDLAGTLNFTKGKARSLRLKGIYFFYKSDYPKALEHFRKALELNILLDDKDGLASCYNNIGVIYKNQANYFLALKYYKKTLEIDESSGNKNGIATYYLNAGQIYNNLLDYQKALEHTKKALVIYEEMGLKRSIAYCYQNLGISYSSLGNNRKAMEYYQKSIRIREELGDKSNVSRTYINLGKSYLIENNYQQALEYYHKSIDLSIKAGSYSIQAEGYNALGRYYLYNNNPELAYQYAKKANAILQEIPIPHLLNENTDILAKSSEALGYYKEAYKYQIVHKKMNDSLNNVENVKKITSLEFQYQYEKEKQLAEQEQQKLDALNAEELKRQKVMRNSLLVGFLLLLIIVFIIYRNFIQKQKANTILTEQKEEIQSQAEELDIRNGKLKDLNATKDKFFSIISHDLKNPFNTLLGMSDLLLDDENKYNEQQRKEYLQHINDSTSKTYKLLENLLSWSNSQTGMINYVPEMIQLKPLVDELVLLFKESSELKNIKLQLTIEKSLKVFGDRNMLDTLLRNLISNAIKFTPKGGEISINAAATEKDPLLTRISIQDNGVGISEEKQTKLFKISEEVITKGTEEETGTGLGLILCKEFVEKQGGEIWIKSKEGKGTTVYFTIPNEASNILEDKKSVMKDQV